MGANAYEADPATPVSAPARDTVADAAARDADDERRESIGAAILDAVKVRLGTNWGTLPAADRVLIAECALDAGALQLAALATSPADAAAQQKLLREKAQIHAQLANIDAAAASKAAGVADAFWAGARDVALRALEIALARL